MNPFALGDRFIAMHSDLSAPIYSTNLIPDAYAFPDGLLKENTVYHVERVRLISNGLQGLFITGQLALYGDSEIAWHNSRFREVELLAGHTASKRHRKKHMEKHEKPKACYHMKRTPSE